MAKPVQQLGEAPLGRVNAAAPFDAFEAHYVRRRGNLLGFGRGAMVAPEVVLTEWFQSLANGNHAGAGGVERDGGHCIAVHAGRAQRVAGRGGESSHLVGMGLGSEIRVFAAAMKGIRGGCGADRSALAVDESNANAEGAEINAGDDGHGKRSLGVNAFSLEDKSTPCADFCALKFPGLTAPHRGRMTYFFPPGNMLFRRSIRPGFAAGVPAAGLATVFDGAAGAAGDDAD